MANERRRIPVTEIEGGWKVAVPFEGELRMSSKGVTD